MWIQDLEKPLLLKRAIELNQFPRYVYKYKPLNKFTERIFKDSNIWFAKPNTLNDPFDCQIVTKNDNTKEEILAFLKKRNHIDLIKNLNNGLFTEDLWNQNINEVINTFINKCGISCFAGSNDNILMWSHYTNSHKGICIKFDILEDLNFFMLPLQVKYSELYPEYNHIREDRTMLIEKLFQTKAKCWEYENEIRILKPLQNGNIKFNKAIVKEICFGVNTNESEILFYKNLVKKNNFQNIIFKKAKVSKNKFNLVIEDI